MLRENGKIESIKLRGKNALSFFRVKNNEQLPDNLLIEKSIDFFVNDIAEQGYNIFRILFKF